MNDCIATPQNKKSIGVEVARSRRGSTVYVEPHSVVALSAAARAAEEELQSAEARLFHGLCQLVRSELKPLLSAIDAAAELDAVLTRASTTLHSHLHRHHSHLHHSHLHRHPNLSLQPYLHRRPHQVLSRARLGLDWGGLVPTVRESSGGT